MRQRRHRRLQTRGLTAFRPSPIRGELNVLQRGSCSPNLRQFVLTRHHEETQLWIVRIRWRRGRNPRAAGRAGEADRTSTDDLWPAIQPLPRLHDDRTDCQPLFTCGAGRGLAICRSKNSMMRARRSRRWRGSPVRGSSSHVRLTIGPSSSSLPGHIATRNCILFRSGMRFEASRISNPTRLPRSS